MTVLLLGPYPPPHGGVQTNLVAIRQFLLDRGIPCSVINLTRCKRPDGDGVSYPSSVAGVIRRTLALRPDIIHMHFGGVLSRRLLALAFAAMAVLGATGEVAAIGGSLARASLLVDPAGGTVLWSDSAGADEAFEAFLLEVLSDFQVTIPELGTVRAEHIPYVVLTSNRTREIGDALRRRCLYLYVEHPTLEKEVRILRARVPEADARLASEIARFVQALRRRQLSKAPGLVARRQTRPLPSPKASLLPSSLRSTDQTCFAASTGLPPSSLIHGSKLAYCSAHLTSSNFVQPAPSERQSTTLPASEEVASRDPFAANATSRTYFSCGLSPVLKEPLSSPVVMSRTCTVLEVEAETATRLPSGETAMWSER